MHEYIYADRILQSVLEYMETTGKKQVSIISIRVGELLGLDSNSLGFAYRVLSAETIAKGSRLRISITRSSVRCDRCGYEGRLQPSDEPHTIDPVFPCPECGAPLKVGKGNEVTITKIR